MTRTQFLASLLSPLLLKRVKPKNDMIALDGLFKVTAEHLKVGSGMTRLGTAVGAACRGFGNGVHPKYGPIVKRVTGGDWEYQ